MIKNYFTKTWGIWVLLVIFSTVSIYQRKLLKDDCLVYKAKVFKKYRVNGGGSGVKVEFHHLGKKIKINAIDSRQCFLDCEIGDTVLIKYSIRNPKVATTLACFYDEKKHGHLIGKKLTSDEIDRLLK